MSPPRKPHPAAPENDPAGDEPEASPADKPKFTLVRLGGFIDRFVSGIPGVPDITRKPTAVPAASLPQLRDVAKASRIDLIEVQP